MGLGVLEDHSMPHVPGTVLLDDETAHVEVTHGLKHGKGKDAHIVLSPQPSEDPNDPLNWPRWQKEVIVVILCLGTILCASTNGPLINAAYFEIAQTVNMPLTKVVLVSGYNLLAAACSGPFVCAFSRKYGKRPVFLASTLLVIIGTAVGESKKNYQYLLAARIIMGFGTSAYESLIIAAVGDLYFVHQRGLRVAILNFVLNTVSNLTSIICAQVFADLGWLWLFHLYQIFLVFQFIVQFLFVPETSYLRDVRFDTDISKDEKLEELAEVEEIQREETMAVSEQAVHGDIPPRKSFVQQLAVFTGVYTQDSIFKFLGGPFLTLFNPAGDFAIFASGLLTAWYVGVVITLAGIFSGPPWMYRVAQIGYIGAGPLIGGAISSAFVAFLSDPFIKLMTRKNNGVYEPEFRLVMMAASGVMCALGFFLAGHFISIGVSGPLCAFLLGLMMSGIIIGIFATLSYGLDAFRNQSNEIFIMNMLFKNFLFYGLSNFVNDWVAANGPSQIFYVFGGISLFLCLLTIPFYIFGKRMRSWWARHDLFVILKMETTGPKPEMG